MEAASIKDIPDLNDWLKERNLVGFWQQIGEHTRPPERKPFLWKWDDIATGLAKATEVVSMDDTGIQTGRRNIGLVNPRMTGGQSSATIVLGAQCLMPGEVARAHRHTPAAIRFVVKGTPGAYTVVDGEPMPMEAGDLITTPSWSWHDHYNEGTEPVIWLDGLDAQLVRIAQSFREDYPSGQQPRDKPVGHSTKTMGLTSPARAKAPYPAPAVRYPWTDTQAALQALQESESDLDPYDGYKLMYRNPMNGGPTSQTFSCEIQLLASRFKGKAHRHNSTTLYHAFRGSGVTTVEGERLEWSQGDMFAIPSWLWHQHEAGPDRDAILFAMTDWPTLTALGLYREEPI